ncbi:MAG TPA: sulfite exporter TauE/SafE family protein, partial [Dehalococcoidia bacterium]|nr:sulfite exporter TauE/SafE family protein [Dehalococcoidia bacterium]
VLGYLETRLAAAAIDDLIVQLLGGVLILVSAVMLWRLLPGTGQSLSFWSVDSHSLVLPIAGAFVGFLVGLTSVGSGTLIVVLLSLGTGLSASRIVGTDIFHAVLLLAVAGAAHAAAGNVDLSLTASLLVGSVPSVILGSFVCRHFPERPLRLVMAGTLLVSGLRLLWETA